MHALPIRLSVCTDSIIVCITSIHTYIHIGQLVKVSDVIGTTTGVVRDEKQAVLSPREAKLSVDQSYDVYLSFVASDMPFAETIHCYLTKRAGYKVPVCVPAEDMHNEPLVEGVVAEMISKKCRKTILILSPEYFDSEWGRYEATLSVHSQPGTVLVTGFYQHVLYLA